MFSQASGCRWGGGSCHYPACHWPVTGHMINQHYISSCFSVHPQLVRVPTQTGKPGKMGRHFPVREKSGNFEQTGKVREKSWKIAQNTGKLREFEINII